MWKTLGLAVLLSIGAILQAAGVAERAYLKAPDAQSEENFGRLIAMDGDTLVVGAPERDRARGAVFVYTRSGTEWILQATLTDADGEADDQFGSAVAISGDRIVVGSPLTDVTGVGVQEDSIQTKAGSVHVFLRQGVSWTEEATLVSSYPDNFDRFGSAVAISGDLLVVGAGLEDSDGLGGQDNGAACESGAAYIFARGATGWEQEAFLKASNVQRFDGFGDAVTIDGETVAVGASSEDGNGTGGQGDNSSTSAGAVYVFEREAGVWGQSAYLKASNADASNYFGHSLSIDGDTLAVGAYGEASSAGAVYVFDRQGDEWSEIAYLKASNAEVGDYFGFAIDLTGSRLVIGAPREDGNGLGAESMNSNTGCGYVFEADAAGAWLETAYLKASNASAGDQFGWSVAAAGDYVAAGALSEDRAGDGSSGLLGSKIVANSGAVYVFEPGALAGPEIVIGFGDVVIQSGDYVDTFGVACVDERVFHRTLSINNLGDSPLTGIVLGLTGTGAGEFAIDSTAVTPTLAPGESAEFTVSFIPTGSGDSAPARVEISNNDPNESLYLVNLAGFATPLQWLESGEVTPAGSVAEGFGRSMAIDGDTLVVGAYPEDIFSAEDPGVAYVFEKVAGVWIERAVLRASNGAELDAFGVSVAIDGDLIVVGASQESGNGVDGPDDNRSLFSGAAYVFQRQGNSWIETGYLKASNPDRFDYFGETVAVSGGTIAVGSSGKDHIGSGVGEDDDILYAGAVYLFEQQNGSWVQQQLLKSSPPEQVALFGLGLLLSDDRLFVGAENSSAGGTRRGAVFEFSRVGENWVPAGVITASNPETVSSFGTSIGLSGSTLIIGAHEAVYVFVESGGSWTEQALLEAPFTDGSDGFGSSLAISGDRVLVAAPEEDGDGVRGASNNSSLDEGAVFEFTRTAGTWNLSGYLKASDAGVGDGLADSVLFDGAEALIGVRENSKVYRYKLDLPVDPVVVVSLGGIELGQALDVGLTRVSSTKRSELTVRNGGRLPLAELAYELIDPDGSFQIVSPLPATCLKGAQSSTLKIDFTPTTLGQKDALLRISGRSLSQPLEIALSGTGLDLLNLAQEAYLKASDSGKGDSFGHAVAVDGDTVVIGGDLSRGTFSSAPGAVYVFVRRGGSWHQEAKLTASNAGDTDLFGSAVDISGDTIVVGARMEDSSATGVDGNQFSELGSNSGAVYVFVRDGGAWSQQAYIKASNAERWDEFGGAVAIDGDTLVVGATLEDSGGEQVGDDSFLTGESGAVYVFSRSGETWSQAAYLKAPVVEADAFFGRMVSVSGERILVGADGGEGGLGPELDSAYVFVQEAANWNLEASLVPGERNRFLDVGISGEIEGDVIVLGAPSIGLGAAFVFQREAGEWIEQAKLESSDRMLNSEFGSAVGISGDRIIVGNPRADNESLVDSGAAYLFEKLDGDWVQSSRLKASNPDTNDRFGYSVAISGDILLAGALNEDSDATGVHGDQLNDRSINSGAAYVFSIFAAEQFEASVASAGLLGDDALPLAQPFGDGVDNLTKYAFNLDLARADSRRLEPGGGGLGGLPLIEVVEEAGGLALRVEFVRRLSDNLVYVPKMSDDLSSGSWTTLRGFPEVTTVDAEWERVVYLEPLSQPLPERMFGRVEVVLLENIDKPSPE